MKQYLHGIFILSVLLSPAGWALTAPSLSPYSGQWVLTEQSGKVSIYTREQTDSEFAAFKAEAILDQPIANLFAVIADPDSCPQWVEGCLQSRSAGGADFTDRVGYALNHLPWPFSNRDLVVNIKTRGQKTPGTIKITMQSTASNVIPKQEDIVRIRHAYTLYFLEPISDRQTRFIWVQHVDPGGSLPAWLVNNKLIDLPAKSIPKLEALADADRYQAAELIYDPMGKLTNVRLGSGELASTLYTLEGDAMISQHEPNPDSQNQ